jgi:hypothetical protein
MNHTGRVFALAVPLGAAAVLALGTTAAEPLRLEQFEVGWPLDVPENERIFDVPLTADVYRHAASASQLAVLDAAGNPMPFYRVSPPPASATEQRVTLQPSPLHSNEAPEVVAQLSVAATERQTSVTVTRSSAETATEIVAFVVDARAVSAQPVAFELDWRAQAEPFLLDVRIEQSRALKDWQLVGRASVAQLAIGGADVLHKRVPVNASAGGYFRFTWSHTLPDWYLERVTLVSSSVARATPEVAIVAPLAHAPAQPSRPGVDTPRNALYFDAGGALPVSSVALEFSDAGGGNDDGAGGSGWASGSVATARTLDGPWETVAYSTLFYEIDYQGQSFASDAVAVGRREARYWRVATDERLASGRVALRLEFPLEHLRVSAAGAPPYLLAAGTLAPEAGPDATFAAVWRDLPPRAAPPRVAVGSLRELGGAAALQAPHVFPWRTTLLWIVLGGGAFAVAWMAVRLARELKDSKS